MFSSLSLTSRRLLLPAALLLAVFCVLAARDAASAPAKDLEEKFEATQGKLAHVRKSESALSESIAVQNKEIDAMIGEVSVLRQRQAAVAGELAEKQGELETATEELEADKRRLARIRVRLHRALGVLRDRLVAIYESGNPDVINLVLNSSSWSELNARAGYLNQIRNYDNSVAGRVKGLRDQAKAAVRRMAAERRTVKQARDAIAAKEREVARAKQAAEARFAELKDAQAARQAQLEELESQSQALSDNLSAISEQLSASGEPAPVASTPAPLTPGESAEFVSESQASVPSEAPPAIASAIEAANSIATTPYIWGGGHGSFESSGYDCSGSVSFALHGGGFLESPLDSTGLETWGDPGPGKWITVYANAGHAWMIIAGLAFDTVGGPGPRGHSSPVDSPEGFIARHPPGY
jgi:peptidoglycan hydrolase CwlO-like protein